MTRILRGTQYDEKLLAGHPMMEDTQRGNSLETGLP